MGIFARHTSRGRVWERLCPARDDHDRGPAVGYGRDTSASTARSIDLAVAVRRGPHADHLREPGVRCGADQQPARLRALLVREASQPGPRAPSRSGSARSAMPGRLQEEEGELEAPPARPRRACATGAPGAAFVGGRVRPALGLVLLGSLLPGSALLGRRTGAAFFAGEAPREGGGHRAVRGPEGVERVRIVGQHPDASLRCGSPLRSPRRWYSLRSPQSPAAGRDPLPFPRFRRPVRRRRGSGRHPPSRPGGSHPNEPGGPASRPPRPQGS